MKRKTKKQMGMGMVGGVAGIGGVPIAGAHGNEPPAGLRMGQAADYYTLEQQRKRKPMKARNLLERAQKIVTGRHINNLYII
jgi:hypothetical protein